MRKTIVATMVAAGLGIAGLTGSALAAGADDPTPGAGFGTAGSPLAPTADPSVDSSAEPGGGATPGGTGDDGVGRARATEIALGLVGGGRVTEVEREVERGRLEWKIEVRSGSVEYDVRVDAATGAITRVKWEDEVTGATGEARGDDDDRGGDDRRGRGRGGS
jgi:hypothetical protein